MSATGKVVAVAVLAGLAGVGASVWFNGPGPLLGTEAGQRALHALAEAGAPAPPAGVTVARRGEPMPPLRLPALAGGEASLPGAYAGRAMLINFWASWCGPCIEEMPELERYAVSQAPTGVQVVGIALDDLEAVQAFLARIPVSYPILLDTPGPADASVQLGNPMGVLPYTVLIDAEGRVAKQKIGPFRGGEIDGWAAP